MVSPSEGNNNNPHRSVRPKGEESSLALSPADLDTTRQTGATVLIRTSHGMVEVQWSSQDLVAQRIIVQLTTGNKQEYCFDAMPYELARRLTNDIHRFQHSFARLDFENDVVDLAEAFAHTLDDFNHTCAGSQSFVPRVQLNIDNSCQYFGDLTLTTIWKKFGFSQAVRGQFAQLLCMTDITPTGSVEIFRGELAFNGKDHWLTGQIGEQEFLFRREGRSSLSELRLILDQMIGLICNRDARKAREYIASLPKDLGARADQFRDLGRHLKSGAGVFLYPSGAVVSATVSDSEFIVDIRPHGKPYRRAVRVSLDYLTAPWKCGVAATDLCDAMSMMRSTAVEGHLGELIGSGKATVSLINEDKVSPVMDLIRTIGSRFNMNCDWKTDLLPPVEVRQRTSSILKLVGGIEGVRLVPKERSGAISIWCGEHGEDLSIVLRGFLHTDHPFHQAFAGLDSYVGGRLEDQSRFFTRLFTKYSESPNRASSYLREIIDKSD